MLISIFFLSFTSVQSFNVWCTVPCTAYVKRAMHFCWSCGFCLQSPWLKFRRRGRVWDVIKWSPKDFNSFALFGAFIRGGFLSECVSNSVFSVVSIVWALIVPYLFIFCTCTHTHIHIHFWFRTNNLPAMSNKSFAIVELPHKHTNWIHYGRRFCRTNWMLN